MESSKCPQVVVGPDEKSNMKDNQTEGLLGHPHPSISRSECKKPHTLSRRIVWWCRGRTSHGRWMGRLLLVLITTLCGAAIMLLLKNPRRTASVPNLPPTNTFVEFTVANASRGAARPLAFDLSWNTCPSQQELRTSLHFSHWDKELLQHFRSSRNIAPKMEDES
ncbi:uncharacterized protein LOC144162584 isoform X3 [Haemaphysalis longicornis]